MNEERVVIADLDLPVVWAFFVQFIFKYHLCYLQIKVNLKLWVECTELVTEIALLPLYLYIFSMLASRLVVWLYCMYIPRVFYKGVFFVYFFIFFVCQNQHF